MTPDKDDPTTAKNPSLRPVVFYGGGELRPPIVGPTNERTAEDERKSIDNAQRRAKVKETEQAIELRETYSGYSFLLVVGWLFAVLAILVLHGCKSNTFSLSSNVLIALLTATSAKVIGIFYFVSRYLFPEQGS